MFHKHFGELDRRKYSQDVFKAKSFNFKGKHSPDSFPHPPSLSSPFFPLMVELDMGHGLFCVDKCVMSPIILRQLPSTVLQPHASLGGKIPWYLWESSVFLCP